jgi:putative Mn2+ efflux pump MntP
MRVNGRFLYWGVLLVALGGVLVAADLGAIDTPTLADALRLWPLAIVAIGLSLLLRKTRWSLAGLMLAAALPGIVLGAAFAVAPRFAGNCGARGEVASVATSQGTFDGPATVFVRSGCGTLTVRTAAGNGWQLDAGNSAGHTPEIDSSARSLSILATNPGRDLLDVGRDSWNLTLPTTELDELSLFVIAGHSQVDLAGARVKALALTVNAAEAVVDASAASVAEVSAVVNVGSLSIQLPAAGDLAGSLRVGAGDLRICAPPELGLRVTSTGMAGGVVVNGLQQHESEWQSANYATATHRADLFVRATFGAVEINPIGGCS